MATKRITAKNFIFALENEKFKEFVDKVEDLTKISEKMMFQIQGDKILLYTIAGGRNIHAFKSHIFDLEEFTKKEAEDLKFIFSDAKKVVKTLSQFKEYDDDVKGKIVYNEDGFGEKLLMKNEKLKLEVGGGLPVTFQQTVKLEDLEKNLNIDDANFRFTLKKEDFTKIKKLGTIDNENEFYSLIVKNNKVIFGESSWTLEVDELESQNEQVSFQKKYFNTIQYKNEDDVKIYVFSNKVLINGNYTNLMISTELNI